MKLEGWKNFPTPNPWFECRAGSDTMFGILKVTTKLLLLVYFFGIFSIPLVIMFVPSDTLGIQILTVCFLVWIAMWPVIYLYKKAGYGLVVARAQIIPAYTDDSGESLFFVIFVGIPMFLLGCSMGLVGGFLISMERRKTVDIGVTFMHKGREKRLTMLVPKLTPEEITKGDSIWITKPDFLLPPRPVDRHGRLAVCRGSCVLGG